MGIGDWGLGIWVWGVLAQNPKTKPKTQKTPHKKQKKKK